VADAEAVSCDRHIDADAFPDNTGERGLEKGRASAKILSTSPQRAPPSLFPHKQEIFNFRNLLSVQE
jgi:hypothetical protein